MYRNPSTRYNKQTKRTTAQWREYLKEKFPTQKPTEKPSKP